MIWPSAEKGGEELLGHAAEKWGANGWYRFKDKRFRAWGKKSIVLVPKLAAKIGAVASKLSVIGWVWMGYEAAECIKECQSSSCEI